MEPITPNGLELLKNRLKEVQAKRAELIKTKESDFPQPLTEDSDYDFLISEINNCDSAICDLKEKIANSNVIDNLVTEVDKVRFGFTVKLRNIANEEDEKEYKIVGPYESDVSNNLISVKCRVGQQLIGKCEDDEVDIGEEVYYIDSIKK